MAAIGTRYIRNDDDGLIALAEFIKASLVGDKKCARKLAVDKNYSFIVYTQLANNKSDEHKVIISVGMPLRLITQSGPKGPTNMNVFMADDGVGAWYIDIDNKVVRHFTHNIYVTAPMVNQVFSSKIGSKGAYRS